MLGAVAESNIPVRILEPFIIKITYKSSFSLINSIYSFN